MKSKSTNQKDMEEEIQIEFDPPLSGKNGYSIVSQILPDGTKESLGYVTTQDIEGGNFVQYCTQEVGQRSQCYPAHSLKEIEAGFKKYARSLAGIERTKEVEKIRQKKNQKKVEKGITI